MQGLADEQVSELRLVDEWADKCVPSGGTVERNDPVGRRNGKGQLQFSILHHSHEGYKTPKLYMYTISQWKCRAGGSYFFGQAMVKISVDNGCRGGS